MEVTTEASLVEHDEACMPHAAIREQRLVAALDWTGEGRLGWAALAWTGATGSVRLGAEWLGSSGRARSGLDRPGPERQQRKGPQWMDGWAWDGRQQGRGWAGKAEDGHGSIGAAWGGGSGQGWQRGIGRWWLDGLATGNMSV